MPKNTSPSSSSARARAKKSSDTGAFTREERAAMKERADETRASREGKANGERALLEKIAELPEDDRQIAERLHALVKDVAPDLAPRTWYGMPAYEKDGKVLCFLQAASKFKTGMRRWGSATRRRSMTA